MDSQLTAPLERYIDRRSPVHALDARVKLGLSLACLLALALLPPGAWAGLLACAILIWWTIIRAQVGLGRLLASAAIALPFALVAVTLVFSRPGTPIFTIALGPLRLTASDVGLIAFLSVLLKSWLSVQTTLLLMATTPFSELLGALRALRLPEVFVSILGFAYRYLFVMADEARRMLRARACRAAELPGYRAGGSLIWRARVVGAMVGTLFLRAHARSERIYAAMLARGYNGQLQTLQRRELNDHERGLLLVGGAGLAAIVLLSYLTA
jgi:cobalt/nickel transport system permease protein